jgi:hypothetical protein
MFNNCQTLTQNGTWNSPSNGVIYTSSLSIATILGTPYLDVNITTGASFNQNMLILTGFAPTVWSNVTQMIANVIVDSSVVAGTNYDQFLVVADSSSSSEYFQPIATSDPNLVAGAQSVTWILNFTAAGNMPPTASLSKLTFINNSSSSTNLGNIYINNIQLVTCP